MSTVRGSVVQNTIFGDVVCTDQLIYWFSALPNINNCNIVISELLFDDETISSVFRKEQISCSATESSNSVRKSFLTRVIRKERYHILRES